MNNNLEMAIDEDGVAELLYEQLYQGGDAGSRLLWEILFEVDTSQPELVMEKIYEYGKLIREKDHFGRAIFVRLLTIAEAKV